MQNTEQPTECCADLSAKIEDWKACAERAVREDPIKTAGLAFAAGLFLTVLPVGRILAALVRVAVALLRPALLILGVVKLVQQFDTKNKS